MSLNPGNDTITFVHLTRTTTPDKYGVIKPTETTSVVTGCALQPISEKDRIADTAYAESTNACIAPTTSSTLGIVAEDYLRDINGLKYRIMGVRQFRDGWGRTDHITFMCKYEVG